MKGVRLFTRRWQNVLGLLLVGLFAGIAIAAPRLAPPATSLLEPAFQEVKSARSDIPLPPSASAPLGTIALNRSHHLNIFYNVVWGARSALLFGLTVALSTAIIGILVGAASAFAGGWINSVLMRLTDAFLAFPVIVGIVLFQQLVIMSIEATGMDYNYIDRVGLEQYKETIWLVKFLLTVDPLMLALILFSWMPYARLTNTVGMMIKNSEYIQAARVLGASPARIIFRHLIPNSISPAIVLAARDIGGMVVLQATFTFIGLGGGSEWGTALAMGQKWILGPGGNILFRWWVFFPVTLALVLFGVGFNLLGDGLNDWLNPRTQSSTPL